MFVSQVNPGRIRSFAAIDILRQRYPRMRESKPTFLDCDLFDAGYWISNQLLDGNGVIGDTVDE
ncbi:hypothetical protein D3C73_872420 [compost metagenome]